MKKLIIAILLLFATNAFAGSVNVYFEWQHDKTIEAKKFVILGLPDSPIETDVVKIKDVKDINANEVLTQYKAVYDFSQLPDNSYTIKGKVKTIWGDSPESEPYPFVKKLPQQPLNMELGVQ